MSNRKTGGATSVPMDDYWREQMKDPEFRREYEALEPEFSIRRQLINLRLKHGLSQRQLADRVDTPRPSISRMEAKGVKDLAFAQRLAEALDCTLEVRFVPKKNGNKTVSRRQSGTPAKRVTAKGTRGTAIKQAGGSKAGSTRRKLKV
jgi:DNA-binding XRE family transcriptional regulator